MKSCLNKRSISFSAVFAMCCVLATPPALHAYAAAKYPDQVDCYIIVNGGQPMEVIFKREKFVRLAEGSALTFSHRGTRQLGSLNITYVKSDQRWELAEVHNDMANETVEFWCHSVEMLPKFVFPELS